MKVGMTLFMGLGAVAIAGLVACSGGASEPPAALELASDPRVESGTNLPKRGTGTGTTAPMGPSKAPVLEPSPAKADGGAPSGDEGAGATYGAHCNGYLSEQREHETNDTAATANTLGFGMCAGINSATDVDYYAFDADSFVDLTFDPDDDAAITITSPSGVISSAQGGAVYRSGEHGRYVVAITSPGHKTQTYLLVH
jgi:hypothetical protein